MVSAFSKIPRQEILAALKIESDAHEFYKINIFNDLHKESKNIIRKSKNIDFWIIDLIEERTPLGITDCGAIFTYSQAHIKFSNAKSLSSSFIQPYTESYCDAFRACTIDASNAFAAKKIILHKSFYAKDAGSAWDYHKANKVLNDLYTYLESNIKIYGVVEVEHALVRSSSGHKWGLAPFHYIDEYYLSFANQLSKIIDLNVSLKTNYSMQK